MRFKINYVNYLESWRLKNFFINRQSILIYLKVIKTRQTSYNITTDADRQMKAQQNHAPEMLQHCAILLKRYALHCLNNSQRMCKKYSKIERKRESEQEIERQRNQREVSIRGWPSASINWCSCFFHDILRIVAYAWSSAAYITWHFHWSSRMLLLSSSQLSLSATQKSGIFRSCNERANWSKVIVKIETTREEKKTSSQHTESTSKWNICFKRAIPFFFNSISCMLWLLLFVVVLMH